MTLTPETAPAALQNVERPACANHVGEWIDETGTGVWGRIFRGTKQAPTVGGVSVSRPGYSSSGSRSSGTSPIGDAQYQRVRCSSCSATSTPRATARATLSSSGPVSGPLSPCSNRAARAAAYATWAALQYS